MARRVKIAITRAVKARVELTDADKATVALAIAYAEMIDDGADLAVYGPLLLVALDALLLTPKARQQIMRGVAGAPAARTPLDELRAKRASR